MTAQEKFTAYFVKNYPGPDTIIYDPNWHAPRIFQAAQHAMKTDLDAHIGAVLAEAAAVATNQKGHGWDDAPPTHPYDKGYIAACDAIAKIIRALRPDALQALERVRSEARVEGMREALDELRTLHKSMAHFLRVETWEGYKQGVTDAENAIRALIETERKNNA